MKKLFLVIKRALAVSALTCIVFCASSCRSTEGSSHDQIVKSSIDLASEYCSKSMYDKALDVYDRACSYAEDYRLEYNRAYVLSCLGRNSEAFELCDRMYSVYPDKFLFLQACCEYLCLDGKYGEFTEYALKVLESDPYDYGTRLRLVSVCFKTGATDISYENALTLWNQGYRNKDTALFLYRGDSERWDAVFRHFYPDGDPDLKKTEPETSATDLPDDIVGDTRSVDTSDVKGE